MALQRVLAGYAKHPNVAAYILIGLGCEVNQAAVMVDRQRMAAPGHPERKPVRRQHPGGGRDPEDGGDARSRRSPSCCRWPTTRGARSSRSRRSRSPPTAAAPTANSGITANPALGWAVDELVRYGGTGVLAETPEIYGAEHLLIRRAINEGVAKKLIDRYKWWEWYCRGIEAHGQQPGARQQGGRHHHRLREVAGRRDQGRHDADDGRLPVRRAHHHPRLRLHGHARPRSRVDHRARGGRLQPDLLHHRPRLGVRLQARALHQARHQLASCTATWRRTWTSTAA